MRPMGHARRSWMRCAAGAVVVTQLLSACRGAQKTAASPPPVVEVGKENIVVAARGELQSGPAVSGTLEARNAATVRAEVSGPVIQTYVERGQAVTRGQLLARLDDTALRQAMLSAQSAEASAKLSLENAARNFQRSDTLEKAGAIAQRDLEAAQSQLAAARAAYAAAHARLTQAQQQLEKTYIRAPFAGLVSDRPANAGDVVQPGAALATVIDPRSMRLEASVPSEQIAALRVGAPVRFAVSGYPGRTFVGRIDQINPAADPVTRQVRIYVSIPNESSALVAGLFAQGRVSTETRTALLAPVSAVDQRGVTPAVMRIKGGKAERVPVQLGIRDEVRGLYEITAGIEAGDTLLLGAAQGITPGTPVRVIVATDRTTAER